MSSEIIDFIPSAYHVVWKSPLLYKFGLGVTLLLIGILAFYGHKMYQESQRYHDFFVPNIRIFVEKQYNERTISFGIESLSGAPVYINQAQVAIYDNQKKEEALYSATKLGRVNPLKKGDILPFTLILDNPPQMGFNFTKVIKEHGYMLQTYKVIVVVHYNNNTLGSSKEQRFEYLYNVSHDKGVINGVIREFPTQSNDSELIHKHVPYEINS